MFQEGAMMLWVEASSGRGRRLVHAPVCVGQLSCWLDSKAGCLNLGCALRVATYSFRCCE